MSSGGTVRIYQVMYTSGSLWTEKGKRVTTVFWCSPHFSFTSIADVDGLTGEGKCDTIVIINEWGNARMKWFQEPHKYTCDVKFDLPNLQEVGVNYEDV
jgi:hypothetical protein